MDKKYNMLIPIAGRGQRFVDQGYKMPKQLIMVKNKHLIDWSLGCVDTSECNLIFAVRKEHVNDFAIDHVLKKKFGKDVKIVVVDKVTEGSVCTCLLARKYIDNDLPLFINTLDVYFDPVFDPSSIPEGLDGFILTFKANNPGYSYCQIEKGLVSRTVEKEVISENASVGIYGFRSGRLFIEYAEKMIMQGKKTNNEFYISPLYNLLIEDGLNVGQESVEKIYVIGTPEEKDFFVDNVILNLGEKPIAICCDHSGLDLKESAKSILEEEDLQYIDFGTYSEKDCDYCDFIHQATGHINNKICDFGIGFCRTGQGVNIAANKVTGIRSALVFNKYTAEFAIRHNCVNFFSISSKFVNKETFKDIVKILKDTTFDGGRHCSRIMKMEKE